MSGQCAGGRGCYPPLPGSLHKSRANAPSTSFSRSTHRSIETSTTTRRSSREGPTAMTQPTAHPRTPQPERPYTSVAHRLRRPAKHRPNADHIPISHRVTLFKAGFYWLGLQAPAGSRLAAAQKWTHSEEEGQVRRAGPPGPRSPEPRRDTMKGTTPNAPGEHQRPHGFTERLVSAPRCTTPLAQRRSRHDHLRAP
jgi:hypothetical protein